MPLAVTVVSQRKLSKSKTLDRGQPDQVTAQMVLSQFLIQI